MTSPAEMQLPPKTTSDFEQLRETNPQAQKGEQQREQPGFDDNNAYVQPEAVFFDDGREAELLHFVYGHANINKIRGSPEAVLEAIDEFGRTKKYMMNVGQNKGKIVTDLIQEVRPETMIELGGYIGYSAILFGAKARECGGKRYFSLERDPVFGSVIMALVDLAGLADFVKVIIGPSDEGIKRLVSTKTVQHIDLMFLDHYKPAYTSDLKLCEDLGLIRKGSVLAADNVISPGNPPYLEYVRATVAQKEKKLSDNLRQEDTEGFDPRAKDQYVQRHGEIKLEGVARGNPKIVYESHLTKSFEPHGLPDGVEITRCTGIES